MFEEREKIEDDILIKGCEGYNMYVLSFYLCIDVFIDIIFVQIINKA